ncbi:MAG: flagellar basal-body rod protein FlgF [Pseudomonadota bacterium]
MDRGLYIAMSGAKQTLLAQSSNSNNLANASTTGFRKDLQQFRSMAVFGPGHPSRVYAMTERPGVDVSSGPIQNTGRELDVAINGDGWMVVQGETGEEAFTRAGDLKITPEGLLQTGAGLQILGNQGSISIPPAQKLEIGSDGTISIVPLGGDSNALAVLDQIKLVNPSADSLEKRNDGLMYMKDGALAEPSVGVTLEQGALEGSNVNAVEALVNMIELARQFELQVKAMHAVDENEAASAQLMRMV